MWKVLSGVAALFLLLSAIFAYMNFSTLKTEKALADRADSNLAAAEQHRETASKSLADTKLELASTQQERDDAQKQLAEATAKLDEATAKLAAIDADLTAKTAEVDGWETQLDKVGDLKQLRAQLESFQTQIAQYTEELAVLKNQQAVRLAEKVRTDEAIDEYKTLISDQSAGRMPALQTSVRSVSPDWGFVVINAGNNRGVVKKAKLDISRGGTKIAEAVVAIVEPGLAVANVVEGSMDPANVIQAGDTVTVAAESVASSRS